MANYNKVILAGNLTRDPKLSYLPSNTPVVEFGMAINRYWTGKDGQKGEETCFVDLSAFGRQAETINQYMSKGKPMLVEGRLKYRQWQTQDGSKRSKLDVIVDSFQFLGGRGDSSGNSGYNQQPRSPQDRPQGTYNGPPPQTGPADSNRGPVDEPPPISDDDVPF